MNAPSFRLPTSFIIFLICLFAFAFIALGVVVVMIAMSNPALAVAVAVCIGGPSAFIVLQVWGAEAEIRRRAK